MFDHLKPNKSSKPIPAKQVAKTPVHGSIPSQSTLDQSALNAFQHWLRTLEADRKTRNSRSVKATHRPSISGVSGDFGAESESRWNGAEPDSLKGGRENVRESLNADRSWLQADAREIEPDGGTLQFSELADSIQAKSSFTEEAAARDGSNDRLVDAPESAMAADEPTAESLLEIEYDRTATQADRESEELIEPQSRKPEQGDVQWQRAEFLLKIVTGVINHSGKGYVENEDYWAKWNSEAGLLSITRKADQKLIVQAQLAPKPERWNIFLADVSLEDYQDFDRRQQARTQQKRHYYRELYDHFAPKQQILTSEQSDHVVAKQVYEGALKNGLSEAEAVKEATLTILHHDYAQEISQRKGKQIALEYVNRVVMEALSQPREAQVRFNELELG